MAVFSLAGCETQTGQRCLVIEKRLVQSVALLDERGVRVSHFRDLRFARAITSDRRRQVVLCFRDAFTSKVDARRGIRSLRLRCVKLLCESTQCERSFILCHLDTQTRLSFATASRAPVEDG